MIVVRKAHSGEADALTALCLRSKAHWGYDAAFMKACEKTLAITAERIARGRVFVAEGDGGTLLGMAAVEPLEAGVFDLAHLFVEPGAIGRRIGERLFAEAVVLVKREGGLTLRIEADPHASGFYERVGARLIGEAPSDAIPGRMLPLFEYVIS